MDFSVNTNVSHTVKFGKAHFTFNDLDLCSLCLYLICAGNTVDTVPYQFLLNKDVDSNPFTIYYDDGDIFVIDCDEFPSQYMTRDDIKRLADVIIDYTRIPGPLPLLMNRKYWETTHHLFRFFYHVNKQNVVTLAHKDDPETARIIAGLYLESDTECCWPVVGECTANPVVCHFPHGLLAKQI